MAYSIYADKNSGQAEQMDQFPHIHCCIQSSPSLLGQEVTSSLVWQYHVHLHIEVAVTSS